MYERIIFLQDSQDTATPLSLLKYKGELAAMEYLKQWHYAGQHETSETSASGNSDTTFEDSNYIMTYNTGLGYIGLEYKLN